MLKLNSLALRRCCTHRTTSRRKTSEMTTIASKRYSSTVSSGVEDEFEALFQETIDAQNKVHDKERKVIEETSTSDEVFEKFNYKVLPSVYDSSSDLPKEPMNTAYNASDHFSFHAAEILHKFYQVPKNDYEKYFGNGLLVSAMQASDAKVFNKLCLMIRKPSLEAIHYVSHVNLEKPPTKILFHGKIGSGKTSCLMHLQHYACTENYLVIPITDLRNTLHGWQEVLFESDEDGNIDMNAKGQQPDKAVQWISQLLAVEPTKEYLAKLTTNQEYIWGVDEVSTNGSTLLSLCEFAMQRPRRASKIAAVVIDEIIRLANEGTVKVAVIVDEVQRLFGRSPILDPRVFSKPFGERVENRDSIRKLKAEELELVCGFRKLLDKNWKNGVVIASVRASELKPLDITPRSILGIDAFNYLMPFIPIEVPNYNKGELRNQIAFFRDQKWLQTENIETQEQIEQLSFLSNRNPARLYDICCLL